MAYIRINRKLFDHFLWKENRIFSKAEAWIDLIQLTSYTVDNEKIINGVLVKWGRGEYPVSYSFLCKRWNWSIQKCRTYIGLLLNSGLLTKKTTNVTTIIKLCKYDLYNPISQADTQSDNKRPTSDQQEDNKYNKDKELKEEEGENFEKWKIENDKRNEEFMKREELKEFNYNKEYPNF